MSDIFKNQLGGTDGADGSTSIPANTNIMDLLNEYRNKDYKNSERSNSGSPQRSASQLKSLSLEKSTHSERTLQRNEQS